MTPKNKLGLCLITPNNKDKLFATCTIAGAVMNIFHRQSNQQKHYISAAENFSMLISSARFYTANYSLYSQVGTIIFLITFVAGSKTI